MGNVRFVRAHEDENCHNCLLASLLVQAKWRMIVDEVAIPLCENCKLVYEIWRQENGDEEGLSEDDVFGING